MKPQDVSYKDSDTNVSVYCFHVDLMLILRARLFTLKNLVNERVRSSSLSYIVDEDENCKLDVSLQQ
jgi:hypothetical protein